MVGHLDEVQEKRIAVKLHTPVRHKVGEHCGKFSFRELDTEQAPQYLAKLRRCDPLPREPSLEHSVLPRTKPTNDQKPRGVGYGMPNVKNECATYVHEIEEAKIC